MARRNAGVGRFGIRTMVSAEPWTVPGCGSLIFLAVGGVCERDTIHGQVYAGLAGEPALGPPGCPHRASAIANPVGPVTHHWLDSTHVTFGVLTVGAYSPRWKAETSVFNGREADDSRIDLDLGAFDSVSARASFLPTERLALQVSAARLRDAATDFPFPSQDPATRLTASAVYHRPLAADGVWATTVAFGANHAREIAVGGGVLNATTAAGLVESSLTISESHTVFGRGEVGGMPAHHLHAHEFSTSVFAIGKVQIGYVRHLRATMGVQPGIGATVAISLVPRALEPNYSGRTAPSFGIFFSLNAARHQM